MTHATTFTDFAEDEIYYPEGQEEIVKNFMYEGKGLQPHTIALCPPNFADVEFSYGNRVDAPVFKIQNMVDSWINETRSIDCFEIPDEVVDFFEDFKKGISTSLSSDIESQAWTLNGLFPTKFLFESSFLHFQHFKRHTFFHWLLTNLKEIFYECSKENWDGYEAVAISKEVYSEAIKILNLLPSDLPLPEISPDPEGEIGLEWYKDKNHNFGISLTGRRIITFSGIFGAHNNIYGTEVFNDVFPEEIIQKIKRLFS